MLALAIPGAETAAIEEAKEGPPHSPATDPAVLSAAYKAELTEVFRLKNKIGDRVWPGLGGADIPIVLYNDSYEFLVGMANPGNTWDLVKEDDFMGKTYHRRAAKDSQSFAIQIGKDWAGSVSALDLLNRKAPFKIRLDSHVIMILHEAFHAYQARLAPERFATAVAVYSSESRYPFKDSDFIAAWNSEGEVLAEALKEKDNNIALSLVRKFVNIRDKRRERSALAPDLRAFECELEWLEGLAKYVEMRFYELAASEGGEAASAPYKSGLPFWEWDSSLRLAKNLGLQNGDLRFYLSGMAQARLLDRFSPDWRQKVMQEGKVLEDLLRTAIRPEEK